MRFIKTPTVTSTEVRSTLRSMYANSQREFVFTMIFHSNSPHDLVFVKFFLAALLKLAIDIILEIVVSSCQNSDIDI